MGLFCSGFQATFRELFLKNVPALYLQPLGTSMPLWDRVLRIIATAGFTSPFSEALE